MQEPGFWDDQKRAAAVSADHSRTTRKLESFRTLESEIEDLEGLGSLVAEDSSLADELAEQLTDVERRLDELEEERLFQGPYDAGGAVVSVHSGAGGTDSQDWAEMLLRMYLRWAERRGFKVEMSEVSPGGRPASSRRPFSSAGRTPMASSPPRRACTGSSASRRSTPRIAATRASRLSR